MKKFQFYLLLIFYFFSCKEIRETGEEKEAIKSLMNSYATAVVKSDWPGMIKTFHPEIFKNISRQTIETAFKNAFMGTGIQSRMKEMKIDSIYPVVAYNSRKYSLVTFHSTIDMTFSDSLIATYSENQIQGMCDRLKANKDYVNCAIKEKGIIATLIQRCYAIYEAGEKKWFCLLVGLDDSMLNNLVPADVRKKFEN